MATYEPVFMTPRERVSDSIGKMWKIAALSVILFMALPIPWYIVLSLYVMIFDYVFSLLLYIAGWSSVWSKADGSMATGRRFR